MSQTTEPTSSSTEKPCTPDTTTTTSSSGHKLADLGSPCWIEIPSLNVPAARTFYETLFSWTFSPPREGYPSDTFAMFMHNKPQIMGAIRKRGPDEPQPGTAGAGSGTTVFVYVDDVDSMLEKIVAAGGEVVQGRTAIEGHTILAKYKDLDGNVGGILKWLV